MTEHHEPTPTDHAGPSRETEMLTRSLKLARLAGEVGYAGEGNPGSILDLVKSTNKLHTHEYRPVLIRAHELGLLSDTASSHMVDSLRYVLESTHVPDRPFYDLAVDDELDPAAQTVVEHWDELELLLGIDRETSKASLEADRKERDVSKRRQPHPDYIHSGQIMFESQGAGAWGARVDW